MPATPVYALPYPSPTDPADGPAGFQALANRVEAVLAPPVSSLPASPVDGQVAHLKVTANGPVWSFVYLAASAAPYRWHFLGGPALRAQIDADEEAQGAANAWSDALTPGPAITAPLAGEYHVTVQARMYTPAALVIDMAYAIGAGAVADNTRITSFSQSAQIASSGSKTSLATVTAAATAITAKYRRNAPSASFSLRVIAATPVRVG